MLKCLALVGLLILLSSARTNAEPENDLDRKDGLNLRFTGQEAQSLYDFLKTRIPESNDKGLKFRGDKMSLACSEREDCYLYLSQKEWRSTKADAGKTLALQFTLPMGQTALSGRLMISPLSETAENSMQLQLLDTGDLGQFAFGQELRCPVVKSFPMHFLQKLGDCQLETAASKKVLPYQESEQFVSNADNVVTIVRGPWAEKFFQSGPPMSATEADSQQQRVKLGSDFYCWKLTQSADPYVCQIKTFPMAGRVREFSGSGLTKASENVFIDLNPQFDNSLLRGFDLVYESKSGRESIDFCPDKYLGLKHSNCSFILNFKGSVEYYPLYGPVQGVAVGWGLVPNPALPQGAK